MFNLLSRSSRRQSSNSSPRVGRQTQRNTPTFRANWRGTFEYLEHRTLLTVTLNSSYTGLDIISAASGGYIFTPPDTCGAAGPTSYVETSNQAVRIYTPKTTGASFITRSMDDFLFTQGGLARANGSSTLSDVTVVFDDLSQRFIVGDQDVDDIHHVSTFDIAVSKSASPATLTTADWNFYRINTTQANHDADYPGNMGFNHDAFVFTLTQFATKPTVTTHVQVTAVAMSDLVAGNPITPFQKDITSNTLRPTTMHDSVAGDPMWFVAQGSGSSINVVKMTNVLSSSATFTTTNLPVNAYSPVVAPRQPNGTTITTNIDSRILKAAEFNNTIVATHAISTSATEDDARWYAIDVSGATPTIMDQGNVSAGNNNYLVYPSIDINSMGDIGMTYLQSGTGAGQFMSMYVTGREVGDAPGTMETPVLVKAGVANEVGGREGDLSGINVDSDGSFWAANEWAADPAATSTFANWSTAIAHFTLGTISTPPTITPPVDQVAVEGASQEFDLGSFSDPDGGPWSVTVTWGDGLPNTTFNIAAAGSLGTQPHVYSDQGFFTVTVSVQDSTALSDVKTFEVNVADAALNATGVDVNAFKNLEFSGPVATFTDANPSAPLSDYTATIDWGDTHISAGTIALVLGVLTVNGINTYAETGSYPISVTINDVGGSSANATSTASVVDAGEIVGRFLFYNESGTSTRYDGNDLAINSLDDLAIATDKTAYLWEDAGAATFANVSSYTKGINGIMVDISGSHPSITADDFIFRVGNNNSPGLWGTANAPTSISVRAGAGVGGSDRVEIIWNTGAPIKEWLNVIVLANADTGLAQAVGFPVGHGDQFFFGNAVGNTGGGDTTVNSTVNVVDEAAIRANPAALATNIPITNIYDVGRNASVNVSDESAARLNGTNSGTALKYLNLTTAPAAPEADGGEISPLVAGDSGMASALAAPALTSLQGGVPRWLENIDLSSIDLNSGSPARLFQYLHDANTPRSRALLRKFDDVADALGMDDELLDELLADLK